MAAKRLNRGCEETSGLLALYHFAELDPDQAAAVEMHLAGCPACRAELEAIRNMLGGIKPQDPPHLSVNRSVSRVRARIGRRRAAARLMRFAPVALAASIAVLAAAIYYNMGAMNSLTKLAMNTAPRPEAVEMSAPVPGGRVYPEDVNYEPGEPGIPSGVIPEGVTTNEDEALLLALLDGPPAEHEGALVPYHSAATETVGGGEDPPIYTLVAMEPLSDIDVIHQLDNLEDYDTLAEIQDN